MNAYLEAMKEALLAGFYMPDIEIVYIKYDDFRYPHVRTLDYGY